MQNRNTEKLHTSAIWCSIWCKPVSSSGDLWHQQASEWIGREEEEPREAEAAGAGEAEGGAEAAGEGAGGTAEGGGEVRLEEGVLKANLKKFP